MVIIYKSRITHNDNIIITLLLLLSSSLLWVNSLCKNSLNYLVKSNAWKFSKIQISLRQIWPEKKTLGRCSTKSEKNLAEGQQHYTNLPE